MPITPTAKFIQDGKSIDYTPSADVYAGDVIVQGSLIGVARRDIAANTLGALWVDGVYSFPKATGGGTAINAGTELYWDNGAKQATTTVGSNVYLGKAIADAGDNDETVTVRLKQ